MGVRDFEVIIEDGAAKYKIGAHAQGLCYEIWQWKNVKKRDGSYRKEWVHTGLYPCTLNRACEILLEEFVKTNAGKCDVKALKTHITRSANAIKKVVKETGYGQ